ncbi:transmembrane protein 184C [Sitodiplosis mosellana]|uniref:transmembrane protein 184C n=1 Tax=Sitodiplosis mosellana TaxID=263140 RepID=UPI002444F6E8|nr:transmembrane protein 184C [Sitodiplosis mosellana]
MCKNNCVSVCSSWQQWIKAILILLYTLFVLIVVPWLIVYTVKDGFTRKDQLILVGGLFVLTSVPLCIWHILQHMLHFTKPILQKPIIRILWMVPIYSGNAFLGLIFPAQSFYMNSVRECYEGYVIYNFMSYILNFLNLEMDLEASLEYKPPVKHVFPLCCMEPWKMGREFVHNCKHGVLQYVVIRPILTIISLVAELNGFYGDGDFSTNNVYPYIVVINNISQFTAMYCLVLFYRANKDELKPMKPLPKFMCIKAVVFFTFVQSVIIDFLVYFGYIKDIFGDEGTADDDGLSVKLQDFLICIEMFIAAIAHKYSFPHQPYHINIPNYGNDRTWFNYVQDMWDMTDVQQDLSEHIGVVGSSLSRRFRGRSSYHMTRGTSETERLMNNPNLGSSTSYQQHGGYNINSASDSEGSNNTNHYGAMSSSDDRIAIGSNDDLAQVHSKYRNEGISIRNQKSKEYSPQYGVPKVLGNYFVHQPRVIQNATQSSASSSRYDQSTRSDNTTSQSRSEVSGFDISAYDKAANVNKTGTMKKSDSTASDWLSTPTDDFLGIDVKGIEKEERSHFRRDPKI